MGYKNYSADFKAKVVIEALREDQSIGQIASAYNINPNMLRRWKQEFLEKASRIFEDDSKALTNAKRKEGALEKKNEQMLKTIGQLTLERDFLQDCFRRTGTPIPELGQEKF